MTSLMECKDTGKNIEHPWYFHEQQKHEKDHVLLCVEKETDEVLKQKPKPAQTRQTA